MAEKLSKYLSVITGSNTLDPSNSVLYDGNLLQDPITKVTASYTALASDKVVHADATSGNITVTLPDATLFNGRTFSVVKIDASGNSITVGVTGSQTINGASSQSISSQYGVVTARSNGTNWLLTSSAGAGGSFNGGTITGALVVNVANAASLVVGPNGTTNPTLNVDTSVGSAATGLNVQGKAAASGLALSVISSGTNENLTIDAKGSGSISIGTVSTGTIAIGRNSTYAGTQITTVASANALVIGANGATNPVLQVDTSTASVATGISVTGAAAAGGVAIAAISSGTNEALTISGKGSGTVGINTASTTAGLVTIGNSTSLAGVQVNGATNITSASANALTVGANGATNPVLQINANTASVATGLNITGAAAAGGVSVSVISSGTNEALTIAPKGTGALTLGNGLNTQINIGTGGSFFSGGGAFSSVSTIASRTTTSPVAGGQIAFGFYNTAGFGMYVGSGAPTISAAQGSIYLRTDGSSTSTRAYINNSAGSGTTWTAITTAA